MSPDIWMEKMRSKIWEVLEDEYSIINGGVAGPTAMFTSALATQRRFDHREHFVLVLAPESTTCLQLFTCVVCRYRYMRVQLLIGTATLELLPFKPCQ